MLTLNIKGFTRYNDALLRGITIEDTPEEIAEIVMQQEIVSYCTDRGCVSFDTSAIDIGDFL